MLALTHEQWNGSGYPDGLKGEQIPIPARILAVTDIYDALRSERAYKPTFSHEKTYKILTVGDDRLDPTTHFEPWFLEVFKDLSRRIQPDPQASGRLARIDPL